MRSGGPAPPCAPTLRCPSRGAVRGGGRSRASAPRPLVRLHSPCRPNATATRHVPPLSSSHARSRLVRCDAASRRGPSRPLRRRADHRGPDGLRGGRRGRRPRARPRPPCRGRGLRRAREASRRLGRGLRRDLRRARRGGVRRPGFQVARRGRPDRRLDERAPHDPLAFPERRDRVGAFDGRRPARLRLRVRRPRGVHRQARRGRLARRPKARARRATATGSRSSGSSPPTRRASLPSSRSWPAPPTACA